jgi:hypothetical protein
LQTASKHFSDDWNVRFPESLNLILSAAEVAWLWLCKNNFIDIGYLTLQELTKTLPYGQRQTLMTALLANLKKLCF